MARDVVKSSRNRGSMDTAPKDGTIIWLCAMYMDYLDADLRIPRIIRTAGCWSTEQKCWVNSSGQKCNPEFWQEYKIESFDVTYKQIMEE